LDGNIHKLRGIEEFRYTIYYHCASQFGWDKEKVDNQPVDYLRKLFATHTKIMKESSENNKMPPMGRNMAKNFK
jgi:hypothetical protein